MSQNKITETMYYDSYEYEFGDGFYPVVDEEGPCAKPATITFASEINDLRQIGGNSIRGLDGNNGYKLLTNINAKNKTQFTRIYNKLNVIIYDKNM